jgi:cell division protein FtsL
MEKNVNQIREINWEKIGVYIATLTGFMTVMFYIIEMKVDIAKLQIKVEKLEEKK